MYLSIGFQNQVYLGGVYIIIGIQEMGELPGSMPVLIGPTWTAVGIPPTRVGVSGREKFPSTNK